MPSQQALGFMATSWNSSVVAVVTRHKREASISLGIITDCFDNQVAGPDASFSMAEVTGSISFLGNCCIASVTPQGKMCYWHIGFGVAPTCNRITILVQTIVNPAVQMWIVGKVVGINNCFLHPLVPNLSLFGIGQPGTSCFCLWNPCDFLLGWTFRLGGHLWLLFLNLSSRTQGGLHGC